MKTRKLLLIISLILLTAPLGVVKGQGYILYSLLRKAPNNRLSQICRDYNIDVNILGDKLAYFEETLQKNDSISAINENYNHFLYEIKNIRGTDDEACRTFLEAYLRYGLDQNFELLENHVQNILPHETGYNILSSKTAEIQQKLSDIEKNLSVETFESIITLLVVAIIFLFVIACVLFLKTRKLNKKINILMQEVLK